MTDNSSTGKYSVDDISVEDHGFLPLWSVVNILERFWKL